MPHGGPHHAARRVLWGSLLLLALTGTSWSAPVRSAPVRSVRAATPQRDDRSSDSLRERGYDALHYRIDIACDIARQYVGGRTSITLRVPRHLRHVAFDAVNMRIIRVARAGLGTAAAVASDTLPAAYDGRTLRVDLGAHRRSDTVQVVISHESNPTRGMRFVQPSRSYPRDPVQLWTQGQKSDARHWFPCNDHPGDRATSEVIATLPDTLMAISNGRLIDHRSNGDGTATWHWRMTSPHATYLVALGAGRWGVHADTADGVPIASWHAPGDDPQDVARTYRATGRMLRFFAARSGIAYPWDSYTQVSMRHFPYGGMENTTVTFMADTRMVTDARTAVDQTPDALIAHELAHQWWGDLVTCRDWEHLWLNEGFATYFQQLWTEHDEGRDAFDRQRVDGMRSYMDWIDRAGAIALAGADADAPPNTYAKGAAVLHMLRMLVGDEIFFRIVRQWGERHRYGSVVTRDFRRVCEDVSGRDLGWFFAQWVARGGYPVLDVTHVWKPSAGVLEVHVRQRSVPDSMRALFRLPLEIAVVHGDALQLHTVDLGATDTTLRLRCAGEPSLVTVDPSRTLLARIEHRQGMEEWIAQLRRAPRAVVRADAASALREGLGDARVRRAFADAGRGDTAVLVRVQVARMLADVDPDSLSWRMEYRAIALVLARDSAAQVRAHAFNALGRLRDAALRRGFTSTSVDSMEIVEVYRRGLADPSVYVEASAMAGLLAGDRTAHAVVIERLGRSSHKDVLALAAMDLAAEHRIVAALPELDRLMLPGGSRDLRIGAVLCAARLGRGVPWLVATLRGMAAEDADDIREAAVAVLRALRVSD